MAWCISVIQGTYVQAMIMWNVFHNFNNARYYLGVYFHVYPLYLSQLKD